MSGHTGFVFFFPHHTTPLPSVTSSSPTQAEHECLPQTGSILTRFRASLDQNRRGTISLIPLAKRSIHLGCSCFKSVPLLWSWAHVLRLLEEITPALRVPLLGHNSSCAGISLVLTNKQNCLPCSCLISHCFSAPVCSRRLKDFPVQPASKFPLSFLLFKTLLLFTFKLRRLSQRVK